MAEHPEASAGEPGELLSSRPDGASDDGLEPTVGEQLRLGQFLAGLEHCDEAQLRELAKAMAHQVLVSYPAAIRYLAREAARNLGGAQWDEKRSERLLAALQSGANGRDGMRQM